MDRQPNDQGSDIARQMSRYGALICLVVFVTYMLVFFHRICPSVIALEMQASFGVGGTLLGLLGSAYFYPYGIMQLPVGLLADSWGPRKTVAASMLVAALGSGLMGLTSGLGWAITGRILVGLGVSTVYVCNFKLLTEWYSPHKMITAGGIFMAMGGVGALAASAPLAYVSSLVGWRGTLALVGGLSLVMAVLVYWVVRDRPSDKGWPDISHQPPGGVESRGRLGLWAGVGEVVTARRFWPIAIWAFCTVGMAFAVGGMWSVPYLQSVYHLDKGDASLYQTTFGLALILGSPFLSKLANLWGRKPVFLFSSVVLLLTCAAFYLWVDGLPPVVLFILFFVLYFSGAGSGPIIAVYAKELFDPAIAGTSVGLVNFFPFLGGGILQVVMGAILAGGGQVEGLYGVAAFREVFGLSLICAAASLVAAFFMPETFHPRKKKEDLGA